MLLIYYFRKNNVIYNNPTPIYFFFEMMREFCINYSKICNSLMVYKSHKQGDMYYEDYVW